MSPPVRLHFQRRPWDLLLVEGYMVAMAAVILVTEQGLLAAILMVLFVPGYVLVAALFPGKGEIDWIERIALSFGLSIAVVPILGLLLNFTPFGIRLVPIVASIAIVSTGLGLAAYWRRMQLPVEQRLDVTLEVAMPKWREYSALDKALTVGLVASLLFAAGVLAYVITTPRPGEAFTEFGLLGPEGRLGGYPSSLNVSQNGTVILVVANHEFQRVEYAVQVDLVGIALVYNESLERNETVELNRTPMETLEVGGLEHGANWTQPYTFRIDAPGLWQVQFLLFRDGDLTTTYKHVHLRVRVGAA